MIYFCFLLILLADYRLRFCSFEMENKGVDVKADTYQNTSTTAQDAQKKAKDDDELLDKAKYRNFWVCIAMSTTLQVLH